MKTAEYALYKGENLLYIGTLDELQKKYKVKRERKGNFRVLVKID